MSMNGVNNLNKAEIAKLALAQKSGKTATTQQPAHLTKNGSIFNAPETKQTEQPKNVGELKTLNANNMKTKAQCEQALKDINTLTEKSPLFAGLFKGKIQEITAKKNELSHNASMQNLENMKNGIPTKKSNNVQGQAQNGNSKEAQAAQNEQDISASEGKKMAANMDKTAANVESQRAETEQNTKKATQFSSDAQKNQKQIVKQQKDLQKQQQATNQLVQENQQQITTLMDELATDEVETQTLQAELDSLTAGDNTGVGVNSAFSLSLAGTEEHDKALQAEDPNAARIADLQGRIGAKNAVMTAKGQKIGKLQTSTNKQIQTMHKVSTRYMAGINSTQKTLEANQSTSQKIMNVANKVDEISSTVVTAGQALDYTGKALVALGSATSWCFGAGAALISAGTIMQKVGSVAQVVGQYGQMAAGITKTACFAAQGNLAGALTSAGSAVLSGSSAIKGTKEMGQTFNKINEKANEATQKLAEKTVAKEAAKEASKMAKEKGSELTKGQIKDAAQDGVKGSFEGKSTKEIKTIMKNESSAIKDNALANAKDNAMNLVDSTKGMTKAQIKEGIKNGTIKVGETASEVVKEAAKEVTKEKSKDLFSHDNLTKIGKGLQTAGAKLGSTQPQNGNKQANKAYYAPPPSFQSQQGFAEIQGKYARRA